MRRGPGLLLLLLVLLVALAGCFDRSSPVDVTSYLAEHPVAPGGTAQVPLFLNSTMTFKQDLGLRVGDLPQGWTYRLSQDAVTLPGYKGRLVVVNLTAPQDASAGAKDVEVHVGDTRATVRLNVTPQGAAVDASAPLRVSLLHLDPNGTILGYSEPLAARHEGLEHRKEPPSAKLPSLLHLGEGEAANGTARVSPGLAARLLAARAGETLLLESAAVADPLTHEGPSDGSRLLVRVEGSADAPAAPAAETPGQAPAEPTAAAPAGTPADGGA